MEKNTSAQFPADSDCWSKLEKFYALILHKKKPETEQCISQISFESWQEKNSWCFDQTLWNTYRWKIYPLMPNRYNCTYAMFYFSFLSYNCR